MESHLVRKNDNFVYDPIILGFDTDNFEEISGGSDPTVASNKLRFTQDEIASRFWIRYADVEFILNVPAAPTTGDVRSWGLKVPCLGDERARAEFVIVDDVFSVVAYNDNGEEILNLEIDWDADWDGADISYRIIADRLGYKFFVDGTCVAKCEFAGSKPNAKLITKSKVPMAIHIKNGNNDNMDMTGFIVTEAASIT